MVRCDGKIREAESSFKFFLITIRSSGQDPVSCLHRKISENFKGLILQDGFRFVHLYLLSVTLISYTFPSE